MRPAIEGSVWEQGVMGGSWECLGKRSGCTGVKGTCLLTGVCRQPCQRPGVRDALRLWVGPSTDASPWGLKCVPALSGGSQNVGREG